MSARGYAPSPDPITLGSLGLVGLNDLLADGAGSPDLVVAVIDGPSDLTHPDLAAAQVTHLDGAGQTGCAVPDSAACRHGTFVLGMLTAGRETPAPAICPGCTVVLCPVLCEAPPGRSCPDALPADLAKAVLDSIDAGARIINISLGVATAILQRSPAFDAAIDQALSRGVLVIAAAGNHASVGPAPLMAHPWLIPVAACDETGRLLRMSNIGMGIGRNGLLAPGSAILSTVPGGYARNTGTSVAAPFVSGTAALLWSLRPDLTAPQLRRALLRPGAPRRSIVPPLLDAAATRQALGI